MTDMATGTTQGDQAGESLPVDPGARLAWYERTYPVLLAKSAAQEQTIAELRVLLEHAQGNAHDLGALLGEMAACLNRHLKQIGRLPHDRADLPGQQVLAEVLAQVGVAAGGSSQDPAATAGAEGTVPDVPPQAGDEKPAAAQPPARPVKPPRQGNRGGGGRFEIPPGLPEERIVLDVPEDQRLGLVVCGMEETRRLDFQPPTFKVKIYQRPIYKKPWADESQRVIADPPKAIIEKGLVTDETIVHLAVLKFQYFMTIYRQEDMYTTSRIEISRSTLNRWVIAGARFLEPIAESIPASILAQPCVHLDDTPLPVVRPQYRDYAMTPFEPTGRAHLGRIWGLAAGPEVYYEYTPSREGQWVIDLLDDYAGPVMGDDYRGHKKLFEYFCAIAVFCWAHVLRKFRDSEDREYAPIVVELIKQIYDTDRECAQAPREERLRLRSERLRPIMDLLWELLERLEPMTTPKMGMGNAVRYALRLREGLSRFLENPDVPLDNNLMERGFRRTALLRRNSLFAYSDAGAHAVAVWMTLIESARRSGLNPYRYLVEVIAELHKGRTDYANLRPAAWAAARTTAAA